MTNEELYTKIKKFNPDFQYDFEKANELFENSIVENQSAENIDAFIESIESGNAADDVIFIDENWENYKEELGYYHTKTTISTKYKSNYRNW